MAGGNKGNKKINKQAKKVIFYIKIIQIKILF